MTRLLPQLPRFLSVPTVAIVLALALLLPSAACAAGKSGGPVWHDDLNEAMALAAERDQLVVVNLWATWCGWCKRLNQEVFPSAEFAAFAADKVLVRLDVEASPDGSALQQRFRAQSVPSTLLLDADEVLIGKVIGFATAPDLVGQFQAEVAAWQRLVDRYPTILADGSDTLRRSVAEEFHHRGDGRRAAALYARIADQDDAWLHYLLADAHRLAKDFDAAAHSARRARALATGQIELMERLDLLAFHIAQDDGNCQAAKNSLQNFLDAHPGSQLRRQMQRTLRALESGKAGVCA